MIVKHIIKCKEDMECVRLKWNMLENGKDMTFFQSFAWNALLVDHFYNCFFSRVFSQVVIYESDRIIVPIIVQKHTWKFRSYGRKRGLYFLGSNSYSDYLNFIYDKVKDSDFAELITYISSDYENLPLYFFLISEHVSANNFLKRGEYELLKPTVAVSVELPETVEAYTNLLSKNTRQNLRTALNRIQKENREYTIEYSKGIVAKDIIDELAKIHLDRIMKINTNNSSFRRRLSSVLKKSILKQSELYNNIIVDAMSKLPNSLLVVSKIDGCIAGYLFGFADRESVRIVQNCYVEKYQFYSPMFRGAYDFMCELIGKKEFSEVDFTRGEEDYKYKLGGVETKLLSYKIESAQKRKVQIENKNMHHR